MTTPNDLAAEIAFQSKSSLKRQPLSQAAYFDLLAYRMACGIMTGGVLGLGYVMWVTLR